jgi:surfeit locus 1 family protein
VTPQAGGPASKPRQALLIAALLLAGAGCAGLGQWQLERRAWKLDLIARVEQRVHAEPIPAPGPAQWAFFTAARDEYRRVRIVGTYLHEGETLVHASTRLGGGYWVLTPLRTGEGWIALVNRGFVPPEHRERATRRAAETPGQVSVTGLLRLSEPRGGFLRPNDPEAGRWYSRDVQAIAQARGLARAAPYFIDAEVAPAPAGIVDADATPTGGLTVLAFRNDHLAYAGTWYALALMAVSAAVHLLLTERRLRREGAQTATM